MNMMQSPTEPMAIGSPSASMSHSQYLPSYLIGDQSPIVSSLPNNRLWSNAANSSLNKTPASANTSMHHNQSNKSEQRISRDVIGRPKDKSSVPPISGLLEQSSYILTPEKRMNLTSDDNLLSNLYNSTSETTPNLNNTSNATTRLQHNTSNTGAFPSMFVSGGSGKVSIGGNNSMYTDLPKKTTPSPAQIDPFYTQGESICPHDELDETWVSVFGFPPAATAYILQQFSQYGNIIKHVSPSDGNWIHIHYQSKLQAKKAMSKNGKIFTSNLMIGVTQCIDKTVMMEDSTNYSVISTPNQHQPSLITRSDDVNESFNQQQQHNTSIRPLTAAYRSVTNEQQIVPTGATPQKNNNLITKAMDYMFGW